MAKQTFEDLLIMRIENGIRAVRLGSKEPDEVNVLTDLERLKNINEGMYDDLCRKFLNVVKDFNRKPLFS